MGTIKRFEEIEAWKTARELTRAVYAVSAAGTFARDFGLRDQMRRAAVSILSNIAEGFESRTQGLFVEFLGRAKGSSGELRAQVYVAQDAGYLTVEQCKNLQGQCERCSGQISRFMTYLQSLRDAEPRQNSSGPAVRSSESATRKRSNLSTWKRANDA